MNNKQFEGLINAAPEKRYRSFLNTVADREEIWFIMSDEGILMTEIEEIEYMLVWPRKEFCSFMLIDEDERAISMEIHEFIEKCNDVGDLHFMVFPTEKDTYIVHKDELIEDILEYLQEVE